MASKKALDTKTSQQVLDKVKALPPANNNGCPSTAEVYYGLNVTAWNKLQTMFARMQPEIQKLIKIQTKDILESLDPANIGKSREVKIPNPSFDPKVKRTDSDSTPCKGDNPFWAISYESIYDRDRFRPNVIEDVKKMYLSQNKEIMTEWKEALQEVYKLREQLEDAKEADTDNTVVEKKPSSSLMADYLN